MMLNVSNAGPVTLTVGSNADEPGVGMVGKFESAPPPAQVDTLVQAARRLLLAPNPEFRLPVPGEEVRPLTVSLDDSPEKQRSAVQSVVADQPFLAAEAVAVALARASQACNRRSGTVPARQGRSHRDDSEAYQRWHSPLSVPHPSLWADGSLAIDVTANVEGSGGKVGQGRPGSAAGSKRRSCQIPRGHPMTKNRQPCGDTVTLGRNRDAEIPQNDKRPADCSSGSIVERVCEGLAAAAAAAHRTGPRAL